MDAEEILPVRPVAEMLLRAGADGELPELPEEENTSWYSGAEHLRAAFARATMVLPSASSLCTPSPS